TTRPDLHQRPFSVQTPQGSVLALGTQFTVQVLDAQHTRVAVQEKSVRVQPTHGEARLLVAGQQMDFSSTEALPPQPAHLAQASWRDGGLVALDMPLAELVQELARYRPGYLGCAPEVAHLQVSGAFTLDNTDRALAALAASFAVQVHYRTRYWVRVEAA
ncbi:MAG TPA: FecR domain-containing protein, partial [Acidovorax sp.]|nr:FecR domain-containing protein [Acidovorax sp.]